MIHSRVRWSIVLLILCATVWAGCNDRRGTNSGNPPQLIDGAMPNEGDDGSVPVEDNCADAARWIYLVANDNSLIRFEPDTKTLTPIGTLDCNAGEATPFSMAVDRSATAWVLFSDGKLYKVDATNASCASTSFVPNQHGIDTFGMGFVSNAVGSNDETLFVAGSDGLPGSSLNATLATLDTGTLTVTTVGSVNGSPELTGNGNAELWGFSPNVDPKTVIQINKDTGASLHTYEVNAVGGDFDLGPAAWAFAFWGGRYYMFYQDALANSTSIWALEPTSGAVTSVLSNIGYTIVGAGVSTCAPVVVF